MKSSNSKATALNLAEKCKNILASNWQGQLNTVKADAQGSKDDVFSSKVKYFVKKGKPYLWVPEKELHNVNTVIDERGSFAVASPYPGPLASLLKYIKKFPARVALTGDVVPLKPEKAQLAAESLLEFIQSEERMVKESSYTVSGVLSSSSHLFASRSENLKRLLDEDGKYIVYRFNISSWTFIDGHGRPCDIDPQDIQKSKPDQLVSVDRMGFDVLGKVRSPIVKDGVGQYQWKEFRFTFKEEAPDIETFCRLLVEMEEEAVKKVSSFSGLI
ncbi:hypothetical protein ACFE04_029902 [Oxalis oulophora]